jgi:histidine ammonia-lyase
MIDAPLLSLTGQTLRLGKIQSVARRGKKVCLAPSAFAGVNAARRVIERIVEKPKAVYGINTGLGKFSDIRILYAAQGLDCRKPLRPGEEIEQVFLEIRTLDSPLKSDHHPGAEIERPAKAIRRGRFERFMEGGV